MEILIAPLNWGVGHATRCIPLIRQLMGQHKITLAGDGYSAVVLKKCFPALPFIDLPALNIRYSKNKSQVFSMLSQWHKFELSIKQDKKSIDILLKERNFDLILSDNRYGVYAENIPSILISHQLHVLASGAIRRFQSLANKYFKQKLKPFDRIWVPDILDKEFNLTGNLSQNGLNREKVEFIGLWSQFEPENYPKPTNKKVLAILSGPEPQRSILEKEILLKFWESPFRLTIVAGKHEKSMPGLPGHIDYIRFADGAELKELILESEYIIARAGYSTLMDLISLQRKALIIPTPGQTEQEYLAERMMELCLFYDQIQGKIEIGEAFEKLDNLNPDYTAYFVNRSILPQIRDVFSLVPNRV
jgi:uncharacterized protein (TIGR00661 family)